MAGTNEAGEKRLNNPQTDLDRVDGEEYQFRKRLPRKFPRRPNDVYVNRKTNFKAQLVRCERLLESGYSELFVHGLGQAATRAINLALQLNNNHHGTLSVSTHTSTQRTVEDVVPADDSRPTAARVRPVSAVHLRVSKSIRV